MCAADARGFPERVFTRVDWVGGQLVGWGYWSEESVRGRWVDLNPGGALGLGSSGQFGGGDAVRHICSLQKV